MSYKERLKELRAFRHYLHKHPELSGNEENTARAILEFLDEHPARKIITGIGGNGIVLVYDSNVPGRTIMVRADMDALPIPEEPFDIPYSSNTPGVAHLCGHDGHTAILAGLAKELDHSPPESGKVILLFQPSEENGKGAHDVLEDVKFTFFPDFIFALHNLPGYELGSVIHRKGIFACASTGMHIKLHGRTSHAAEPHLGISPERAIRRILKFVEGLKKSLPADTIVTTTHIRMGEKVFGISPGMARIFFTLRSGNTGRMEDLFRKMDDHFREIATQEELVYSSKKTEYFPATSNDGEAVSYVVEAAKNCDLTTREIELPFGWSEDFGWFTQEYPGALFGLGSGVDHVPLHHPSFDFPDKLLPAGISLFHEIIRACQRHPS
jgi:amidohydrolase